MSTATISKRRRYRLAAKEGFPARSFAVKCQRFDIPPYHIKDRDENGKVIKVPRHRYRAIDIPITRRYYEDNDDDVGQVVIGAEHDLDDRELEFVKKELERYVVRWKGRFQPPKNKPEKRGCGPHGAFSSGFIVAIKTSEGELDYNYEPPSDRSVDNGLALDEPASNYITIVPVDDLRRLNNPNARGGQSAELQRLRDEQSAEMGRLRAELDEANRRIEELNARELADAVADEREELKTPEGQLDKAIQSTKKRGRPPKQR